MRADEMLQSTQVGVYMAHDEGRKSRWSEVTMMMKRSHHMPDVHQDATRPTRPAMLRAQPLEPEDAAARRTLQKIMQPVDRRVGPAARG